MGSPTEAADMQAAAAAALLAIASGLVAADGVDHGDHGAQHGTVLASEPLAAQPVDNSNYYNYNTDTFAPTGSDGFYDPYASNFLTQEQDRTDGGVIGGLSIGVLLTVFLAALLGSIVAPALTAAVTSTDSGDGVIVARIGTTVSDLPNLDVQNVLPEIVLKDVEEEDVEETARALKAGFNFVQNMVSPRVRRS